MSIKPNESLRYRSDYPDQIPTAELLASITKLTEERDALLKQLAAEEERADYAWKNTKIIDKARMEAEARIEELETALKDIKQFADKYSAVRQFERIYQIANKVVPE